MEDCSCPICYETMTEVNVCVTICKHKFHTSCLMMSGHLCPLCKTNLVASNTMKPMDSHYANVFLEGFKQEFRRAFAVLDEECKEMDRKEEENYKNMLKKNDPNKYKLLFGKK